MTTLTPLQLSREIVLRASRMGIAVSNLALQKLAYFAHGWHLALTGQPLLDTNYNFEAWRYGPVVPASYHAFKWYSSNPIPPGHIRNFELTELADDSQQAKIIDQVLRVYGPLEATKLVELSHAVNGPWHEEYSSDSPNRIISNQKIQQYFSSMVVRA